MFPKQTNEDKTIPKPTLIHPSKDLYALCKCSQADGHGEWTYANKNLEFTKKQELFPHATIIEMMKTINNDPEGDVYGD